jgi:hypothetical protein
MTFPNTPSVTNNTTGAAAKPPMTDKEARLECLKQAVIAAPGSSGVISLASRMYEFVWNGATS